jgi:hypothetical protein
MGYAGSMRAASSSPAARSSAARTEDGGGPWNSAAGTYRDVHRVQALRTWRVLYVARRRHRRRRPSTRSRSPGSACSPTTPTAAAAPRAQSLPGRRARAEQGPRAQPGHEPPHADHVRDPLLRWTKGRAHRPAGPRADQRLPPVDQAGTGRPAARGPPQVRDIHARGQHAPARRRLAGHERQQPRRRLQRRHGRGPHRQRHRTIRPPAERRRRPPQRSRPPRPRPVEDNTNDDIEAIFARMGIVSGN